MDNQTNVSNPYNIEICPEDQSILKILGQDPNDIWFSNRWIYQDTAFTVKIKQKLIKLFVALEIYLNHAPRHERYALCDRIRNRELDLIESLAECVCCSRKSRITYVTKLSYKLNAFQALIELFRNKNYFRCKRGKVNVFSEIEGIRRAFAVEASLCEIGNMVGGWIKYIREQQLSDSKSNNLIPQDINEVIPLLSNNG